MSFARDKLYNGYLRRNMPTIVSTVKVRQIMPHLPCLTDHDRENIEAKRETYGNHDGMVLLLDCLKRRENWPEQFIAAIEACEHWTIAAEIRAEYDALRGASNSNPSSPPTTVVRAHVHPAPSANHPPVPESAGDSQPAVSLPAAPPQQPAAQPSPPLQIPVQPAAPQSSAAGVPEDVPPPEPVAEPPKAAQIEVAPPPSTPPPSPATPRSQASGVRSPRREINFHREPVENSESDVQEISGRDEVIPDEAGAGQSEALVDSVEAPQPSCPVEQSETPPCSDLQTTTSTELGPPRSPSPAESNDADVTDVAAPVTTMTPEKPPVQDTTPPAAALEPEETSEPPAQETAESPRRESAATVSPLHAAERDATLRDDGSECLSKPGQLISICPQSGDAPTMRAPSPPEEPYSGDSERLEYSEAAPDTVTSPDAPACSAASSTAVNSVSAPPCVENGIADNHNEPEENQYDSPSQSLGAQEVFENVGHVSGEPSILNMAGQNSTPQAQNVNGEAAKEMNSAPPASSDPSDAASDVKTPSSESYHPSSETAPADVSQEPKTPQDSEEKAAPRTLPANTKYMVAAGVGAIALLMAWKFKN